MEWCVLRLSWLPAVGLLMLLTACQTKSSSPASSTVRHVRSASQAPTTQQLPTSTTIAPATPTVLSSTAATPFEPTPMVQPSSTTSASLVNEGEAIYTAGIGPSGEEISRSATTVGGMMGGGMMGTAGCASCHGPQGQGEQMPMFTAPNITYSNLTKSGGMIEMDGSRGPTYTDALIKRAVESGVGADGDTLDSTMPRWQLTDQQFSALLAYLKTLP